MNTDFNYPWTEIFFQISTAWIVPLLLENIKAIEKTFQALTLNTEQPGPWKPHTHHFKNHPRTITFYLCFASCPAMPFWEIHLFWLPWQGKGRDWASGWVLSAGLVFEELGREMGITWFEQLFARQLWKHVFTSSGSRFFCLFTLPLTGE